MIDFFFGGGRGGKSIEFWGKGIKNERKNLPEVQNVDAHGSSFPPMKNPFPLLQTCNLMSCYHFTYILVFVKPYNI